MQGQSQSASLFVFPYTVVHQHTWCGRANRVYDLKADEHKSNNILIYAKHVDSVIKMKCQNWERKNQRTNMEMAKTEG